MTIAKKAFAAVFAAIVLPLATHANVASASVFCRAFWPATITQCEATSSGAIVDAATGSGLNVNSTGGNNRRIKVSWRAGTVKASAGALNSQGQPISICAMDDASKTGENTRDCFRADPPSAFFLTAN